MYGKIAIWERWVVKYNCFANIGTKEAFMLVLEN